jgi:hypothetical protein
MFSEERPYWFDMTDILTEYRDFSAVANSTLSTAGRDWINQTGEEDQIKTISQARIDEVIFSC